MDAQKLHVLTAVVRDKGQETPAAVTLFTAKTTQ
jgi:hypothetical protein